MNFWVSTKESVCVNPQLAETGSALSFERHQEVCRRRASPPAYRWIFAHIL